MKVLSIQEFTKRYPDNETCIKWLFKERYGTPTCPKCGQVNKYHLQDERSHFVCACGKHQLSPKKDTIFEKSDTDLYKWFYALYLFSVSKNGVAAKELERHLKVTYKTAWRIAKQIRSLCAEHGLSLSGEVEIDETYMGGKMRGGKRGLGSENKTAIFGMVERKGKVSTKVTPIGKATLMPIIQKTIVTGSTIMSDQFMLYRSLPKYGFGHESVNHGRKEYARGNTHTNTIEGFWSQLKRSIDGTHHAVSPKHLQKYVDEFSFRYNHRQGSVFDALMAMVVRLA